MKIEDSVFYPNELTKEDIERLNGWKLKTAVMHFGVGRGDCVRFGYGYKLTKSNVFANKETIHLVADSFGLMKHPIDLDSEIDWDSPASLITECGIKLSDLYKNRIKSQLAKITCVEQPDKHKGIINE